MKRFALVVWIATNVVAGFLLVDTALLGVSEASMIAVSVWLILLPASCSGQNRAATRQRLRTVFVVTLTGVMALAVLRHLIT